MISRCLLFGMACWSGTALPGTAEQAGYDLFMTRCGLCHAVRGTPARSGFGPDLTHLQSRRFLGAGRLPNTPGHLGGWVANAQDHKPGSAMPAMELSGPELQAILAYLQTLR